MITLTIMFSTELMLKLPMIYNLHVQVLISLGGWLDGKEAKVNVLYGQHREICEI